MEWYDPEAVTTKNGSLQITLSQKQTHDLNYQGGMISSWNKFCFTGGIVVASVSLPGLSDVVGLWPAIWTMGNLGLYFDSRPKQSTYLLWPRSSWIRCKSGGHGACLICSLPKWLLKAGPLTLQWPYTYDSCDIGTVPNQTMNGLPIAATKNGDPSNKGVLSYLPGQRLSRCTCPGESHPGPVHSDGSYVGRGAPEIDMFEAQVCEYFPRACVNLTHEFFLRSPREWDKYHSLPNGR